ncbi:tetratricopeptide repeat-containing protein [Mycena vulgaris]|nr:tetratricopeptide repeat-containing protein [Mycena vulgaris]
MQPSKSMEPPVFFFLDPLLRGPLLKEYIREEWEWDSTSPIIKWDSLQFVRSAIRPFDRGHKCQVACVEADINVSINPVFTATATCGRRPTLATGAKADDASRWSASGRSTISRIMEDTTTSNSATITSNCKGNVLGMEETALLASANREAGHESELPDTVGNISFRSAINEVNLEDKATDCFNMAHNLLVEYKAAGKISSLDRAVYLLRCATSGWLPADPQFPECLNYLTTALLTRFIYSGQAEDVHTATHLCGGVFLGLPVQDLLTPMDNNENEDIQVMMKNGVIMLTGFREAHDQVKLENAIKLYQEAMKLFPESYLQQWRVLWELSEGLLIQFLLTGKVAQLDEAVSCLQQVQQFKPNKSICLCAAFTMGYKGAMSRSYLEESIKLSQQIFERNLRALELAQHGRESYELFQMSHDILNLDVAVRKLEEAESLLSWGHKAQAEVLNDLGTCLLSRYKYRGTKTDLEISIEVLRESVAVLDPFDPECGLFPSNLAIALECQFGQQGNPKIINEAIKLHREVLEIWAAPHPNRSMSLNNLASALHTRFKQQGNLKDVAEAIELYREALKICAPPHPDHSSSLNNLGTAILTQFKQQGDLKDLHEAIELFREALVICASSHPNHGISLNNLASALRSQFEQQGDSKDIAEAIQLHRKALEICYASHSDRSTFLDNLGIAVLTQFKQEGDPRDLDEAIELHGEALHIHTAPHPRRSSSLNYLAVAIQIRFQQRGDPKDIDEAIQLHREALEMHATPHPDRSTSLDNLAVVIQIRFQQQGDPKDIDEAIELHREALDICASPNPSRGIFLNNLARAVQIRFKQQGDPKDIDEAIGLYRKALEIYPVSHLNWSSSVDNLAAAIQARFEQEGNPKDIDDCIKLHREALNACAAPHPDHSRSLNNLANALYIRYQHYGDRQDIDEAIFHHREALDICASPHPDHSISLNNLANALHIRSELQGHSKDIEEAIKLHREALDISPACSLEHSSFLNNLANALQTRFQMHGDLKDVNEAIGLQREALDIQTAPHPGRSASLSNLADKIRIRFQHQNNPKDIDECIELYSEALKLCPEPHQNHGLIKRIGGQILHSAYLYKPNQKTLDDAISALQEASTYMSSSPVSRFDSSNEWAEIATMHNHSSSLAAYRTNINLLPQLAALHLELKSRQNMLTSSKITSLASASAACAISLSENNIAVEFLEASRSIFWAQALLLQTPLNDLAEADPQLAMKMRELSQKLEQASFRDTCRNFLTDTQHQVMAIETEAARCRKLNEDWEETIKTVQTLPGFDDFMCPKSMASLRQAALMGPIVILLASKSSFSALIITSSEDIKYVQLPNIDLRALELYADLPRALTTLNPDVMNELKASSSSDRLADQTDLETRLYGAREGQLNMSSDDIFKRYLADIWTTIVKPVFDVLKLKAAGIYDEQGTDCVPDYIVSSYTPTLATLLDPPTHATASFMMTAVIESKAPDCLPLPGTTVELASIVNRVPKQWLTSLQSPTRNEVVQSLQVSLIVHFACHGIQDSKNPLDSGFMLSDGRLKVSQIMHRPDNGNTKRSRKAMSLAFLSACETAKGDSSTPDEAMHLASTLLFVGFRGVVGTMWTMNDEDGPKIADTFYEYLFRDCGSNSVPSVVPDLTQAAEALHLAVAKLRKEPGMTFKRWVPFVHYGI